MRFVFADNANNVFCIGYQGENNAVAVRFNVQTFRKLYGNEGTFHVTHRRHGDSDFYPCIVTEIDGWVDWVVNSADNARDGIGDAELILIINGETVAKSLYHTQTLKANHDAEGPTPEPSEPWMAEALQAKEAAIRAAEEAEKSAKDIEDLTVSAHQLPVGETEPAVEKTRTEDGYNLDFGFPRGGQGGTTYHDELLNRDLPDQHPIDAIEGLRDELDEIKESIPTELADLDGDENHRTVTDTEKAEWDDKQPAGDYATNQYVNDEISDVQGQIDDIVDVIPDQASVSNQLADKDFVNSTVGTNTAYYISNAGQPFNSLAELQAYSGTVTNNDYAFVVGTDAAGNTTYTRYKYNSNTAAWGAEYVLNNSSFTASQWSAIQSGITALLVQSYNAHLSNNDIHVTADQKQQWNAKYTKPEDGIPLSDLDPSDIDDTVTEDSDNLVTSGAVFEAMEGKQPTITANGILKGDGSGGVTAAEEGIDFQTPISTSTSTASSVTLEADNTTIVTNTPTSLAVTLPTPTTGRDFVCGLNFKAGANFAFSDTAPEGYTVEWKDEPTWTEGTIYEIIYRGLGLSNGDGDTIISAKWAEVTA